MSNWSPEQVHKDRQNYRRAVEKHLAKLSKSDITTVLLGISSRTCFLTVAAAARLRIAEAKLKDAERWDGLQEIAINRPDMAPAEVFGPLPRPLAG